MTVTTPGGKLDRTSGLTYREAVREAGRIRRDYEGANGGARCWRMATKVWVLGVNLPGPRGTVTIERET